MLEAATKLGPSGAAFCEAVMADRPHPEQGFRSCLGIVGLASFWVAQRRRTIGVRRALGATRMNILQYFQTENFLLATIGIVVGMLLAYGINLFLMTHYELPRLPWFYMPVGAVALWLIGQLAVLGPALRAAQGPPVVATRSV